MQDRSFLATLLIAFFFLATVCAGCGSGGSASNSVSSSSSSSGSGSSGGSSPADAFSFIVFGDLNSGDCSRNLRVRNNVTAMAAEPGIAFYVQTGDIIDGYTVDGDKALCFGSDPVTAIGAGPCSDDGSIPNGNMAQMLAPIKERAPVPGLASSYFPVIGNHDNNWGDYWYPDPCGQGFCQFLLPLTPADFINHDYAGDMCALAQGSSAYAREFYYSFAYKNSYFIVLRENDDYYGMMSCNTHPGYADCGAYCSDPSLVHDAVRNDSCYNVAQFDWLHRQLEYATSRYEHIFVFSHAVLLGSGDHQPTAGAPQLRALLESYHVKIHFNGHNHFYLRTYPVKDSARNDAEGTVCITVGPGGGYAGEGPAQDFDLAAATAGQWASYGSTSYEEQMTTFLKITVNGNAVGGQVFSLGVSQGANPVDEFHLE
ncbi:MAG: metallophosphoesterase [Desulfobacteraceae bacterium]|nr:metallophosphoesterase [Desulfobacteraceae bacterium]